MADLIATKALKYATRRLLPDDRFTAKNERDARILIGIGKARRAPQAPQKNEQPDEQPDELAELRAEYTEKLGKRPFHGWDADTLREKIAEAE